MTNTKNKRFKKAFSSNIAGILFTLPLLLGILIFGFYPIISSFYYSLTNYSFGPMTQFLGFKNYIYMFSGYERAINLAIFGRTFLFSVLSITLNLVLSYVLALLLNAKLKGIQTFRVLFYLIVMMPAVVSGMVWQSMLDTDYGIMNQILGCFGIHNFTWFASSDTAFFSLIFMNLWGLPGSMILWIAAFNNIPEPLYEAAQIDGAGKLTRFFRVTIPLSTPMIFYNLVLGIIGTLQTIQPYIVTSGTLREGDSIYFAGVKIYFLAFQSFTMGYASAFAWVLFVLIAILTMLIFKQSKWVYYGEES